MPVDISPDEHLPPSEAQSGPEGRAPRARTKSHRSAKPYNPGLHDLVRGKQQWAHRLSEAARARGFLGWHQRGYVPHFDAPGAKQFVTFRLHDSFPRQLRSEWKGLLAIEDHRERRTKLEDYLDRGHGAAWLRKPVLAQLVADAFRHFDGERYRLLAWVVMPNHVHVLFEQTVTPLGETIGGWKSFTAKARTGCWAGRGSFGRTITGTRSCATMSRHRKRETTSRTTP